MSSDTCLSLREYQGKKGRFYILRECGTEGYVIERIGTYTNLRAALIASEEYQRDNDVEYGLSFFPMTD